MKRSRRLEPVVKVAESREQAAARALGEAQARVNAARDQLTELQQYREDYHRRLRQTGAGGIEAARLGDYQRFLDKLDQAIEQQTQLIHRLQQEAEACRGQWFTQRGKARILDTVVGRLQAAEERQAARREQQELDDRTGRRRS